LVDKIRIFLKKKRKAFSIATIASFITLMVFVGRMVNIPEIETILLALVIILIAFRVFIWVWARKLYGV